MDPAQPGEVASGLRSRLEVVVAHGAPAQAAQARGLLAQLAEEGVTPGLEADVDRLVDAYLNDPYLTR
jgi:hypothetical protein